MKANCTPTATTPPAALEPHTRIRKSRASKWRALVLVLVTLAMAAHFVHWKVAGETLTPIEPSESMEFSKRGVINAGLIFFVLAIASTLVFGRWFCGWACHVVAVQDAAGWILKQLRIKPRHIELGLLAWIPWLAFVYMFLAPIVWRVLEDQAHPRVQPLLMTNDFWATFPNWLTALLTFVAVGPAIVWFLGNKGFCNYGCPYGGIFGAVDQLAPLRIRVTDACSGCGHCTAVCTSNVKVHQEVRDWKAVVDPACMKCLDCVSVCPNDALYAGWGAPAVATSRRAGEAKPSRQNAWVRFAWLAAFFVAVQGVFLASNVQNDFDLELTLALAAISLAVAVPLRSKAERKRDYTGVEEILLGVAFLVGVAGMRGAVVHVGLPGAEVINVPFLFALGLAAIFAYCVVHLVRLATQRNVNVQKLVLRANGRWRGAGIAFGVIALAWTGWCSQRVWAQFDTHQDTERHAAAQVEFEAGFRAERVGQLDEALSAFRRALAIEPQFTEAHKRSAGVLWQLQRPAESAAAARAALALDPNDAETYVFLALALYPSGDHAGVRAALERSLALQDAQPEVHQMLAELCGQLGDAECARVHTERAAQLLRAPR